MALFKKSAKPQAETPKPTAEGPNTYDVVFMGAGHNGLVTAAYLAKAGKKVLLLESRPYFGGGVITRDLTLPGFHHDQHSTAHNLLLANPMFAQDELELKSRFGLKYFYPDVPHVTVFPDDSTLFTYRDLDKTCASFATVSQHDADAYRKFAEKSLKVLPMAIAGAFVPPAPMGQMIAMLDQSEEGREFFHTMQSSPLDIANRLFESDKVKIHLLRLISENLQIPDELGTGVGLLLWPALIHTYGIGQPVGGSGKLAEALVKCVEHHGGTVLVDRKVAKVITSGGRATGLVTEDGEEFIGRDAVVASIHPTKLDEFVEGVPAPVIARGKAVTMAAFSPLAVHMALSELPQLRAGP
jgi:phytoene dehydrogenase-like protein